MDRLPLLLLPAPSDVARASGSGGPENNRTPSRTRQVGRIQPRLQRLQAALSARTAELRSDTTGIVPEEVVVLEIVGSVQGFINAVNRIDGLEWLGEIEEEDIPPDDDFFALDSKGRRSAGKALRGRLFVVFSDQAALREILSLWRRWKRGQQLPRNFGRWAAVFAQLRDVRPWGVKDRLNETGVLDDWADRLKHNETILAQVELWFRANEGQRQLDEQRVRALVEEAGGTVVERTEIEPIGHHALLISLPASTVKKILKQPSVALVQCERIQFFRALGQMAASIDRADGLGRDTSPASAPTPTGLPVAGMFDGFPQQNHRRLAGRLVIDDPEDFESQAQVAHRVHGTGMGSLIIWGDLADAAAPIPTPLFVRPIMVPDPRDWVSNRESVPSGTMVEDLVHRATRRMFDGEGGEIPTAPTVRVINLSVGVQDRPFDGALTPLGRLLDWLSWNYSVLFVVSAGNRAQRVELTDPVDPSADPKEFQDAVLQFVARETRNRRLLSPAEAINAIAVGADHADSSNGIPAGWIDPYTEAGLPSTTSNHGMGHRRGIKPDFLAPGGRVVLRTGPLAAEHNRVFDLYVGTLAPGQEHASPGSSARSSAATRCSRGTSNAAAVTTRAAVFLNEALDGLRSEPGGGIIDQVPRALWLKVLLAHGTRWTAFESLSRALKTAETSRQFREYLTRLVGYGSADWERVSYCLDNRVTALAAGSIQKEQGHLHQFPLPPSLSGKVGKRRLTISLAWFTPVNPKHHGWRRAQLWFAPPVAKDTNKLALQRGEADAKATRRGTLQHEILHGDKASAYVDGDSLDIVVSCVADAGALEEEVPYTLAVTLEVAEELGLPIYQEVRAKVQARVGVQPA